MIRYSSGHHKCGQSSSPTSVGQLDGARSGLPPIVLQKSYGDASDETMESELRMQRIEVALLQPSAFQSCAPRPPKYFCNSIPPEADLPRRRPTDRKVLKPEVPRLVEFGPSFCCRHPATQILATAEMRICFIETNALQCTEPSSGVSSPGRSGEVRPDVGGVFSRLCDVSPPRAQKANP